MIASSPSGISSPRAALHRLAFRAMGTDVELFLEAESDVEATLVLDAVEDEFHRLDRLLSRFRGDSELSALNRAGALYAGPELVDVVELALLARAETGGRFDPTVHDALVAAGYDRSFEDLPPDSEEAPNGAPCGGHVHVDRDAGLIVLEPGTRLDLGGIAKGYAVDRACDLLAPHGPCLVSAGGDLAVRGMLAGEPWPVGVETPGSTLTLALSSGAIATSGRDRRHWRRGGREQHHLIDPRTGRPSETDLLRVTVVAKTAVAGEVRAKSLLLAGERQAIREADELGAPCILITVDGRAVRAGGLR